MLSKNLETNFSASRNEDLLFFQGNDMIFTNNKETSKNGNVSRRISKNSFERRGL